MLNVFFQVMFPVLLIFGIGYFIGRKFKLDSKIFSTLSIYVLTPCLIFQALYQYKDVFSWGTLDIFLSVTAVIAFTIIMVEIFAKLFPISKSLKTVVLLTLILSNSGNFGLPVSEAAFGKDGVAIASILLVIYAFYTHTLGVFIAASDKGGRMEALKNMAKVPTFYALVAAMALNYFKINLPGPVFNPVRSIGLAAIPLNLLLVGINLSKVKLGRRTPTVITVSLLKLLAVPAAAFLILNLFGIHGLDFKVSLVQIAMPSAVYCSILATHYNSDGELASEIVLMSLLISALSLTGIIYFLK